MATTEKEQKTINQKIVEKTENKIADTYADAAVQKTIQTGNPKKVLEELILSIEKDISTPPPTDEEVSQRVKTVREKTTMPIEGSQIGLPGTIANLITGKWDKLSPLTPREGKISFDEATKIVDTQIKQAEFLRGEAKAKIDILKSLVDFAKETNNPYIYKSLGGVVGNQLIDGASMATKQDDIIQQSKGIETPQKTGAYGIVPSSYDQFGNVKEWKSTGIEATEAEIKTQLQSRQDMLSAELKMDNAFELWLDMVDKTMQETGMGPGIMAGTITSIMGKTKANEFYEGFEGGLIEYAAAIAKMAMPSSRASRLIDLFKKTAPNVFSTIPSAIENTAQSFVNALSSDMRVSPALYVPNWTGSREDIETLKEVLRNFKVTYTEGAYRRAYAQNPRLVPENVRKMFELEIKREVDSMTDEQIEAEIQGVK